MKDMTQSYQLQISSSMCWLFFVCYDFFFYNYNKDFSEIHSSLTL